MLSDVKRLWTNKILILLARRLTSSVTNYTNMERKNIRLIWYLFKELKIHRITEFIHSADKARRKKLFSVFLLFLPSSRVNLRIKLSKKLFPSDSFLPSDVWCTQELNWISLKSLWEKLKDLKEFSSLFRLI